MVLKNASLGAAVLLSRSLNTYPISDVCCSAVLLLVLTLSSVCLSVCLSPQARVTDLKSGVIVLRIFRDMSNRLAGWQPLKGWVGGSTESEWSIKVSHSVEVVQTVNYTSVVTLCPRTIRVPGIALVCWVSSLCPQPLELICEKAMATCNRPLGPGEGLRRVMECIASGILLPGQGSVLYCNLQAPSVVCIYTMHAITLV